ncbi:MAG: RDD family protein [Ferruginibacter sp.]
MEDKDSIFSDIQTTEVEAAYFQRALTNLIDWAIDILLIVTLYLLLPKEIISTLINTKSYSTYIIVFVLMLVYRLLCLLVFGKTIGMMLCKIKYLNSTLQPLTQKEKLIAVFAVRTSNIKYYKVV